MLLQGREARRRGLVHGLMNAVPRSEATTLRIFFGVKAQLRKAPRAP